MVNVAHVTICQVRIWFKHVLNLALLLSIFRPLWPPFKELHVNGWFLLACEPDLVEAAGVCVSLIILTLGPANYKCLWIPFVFSQRAGSLSYYESLHAA